MLDEQEALRNTVRTLLTREGDTRSAMATSAGYDEKLWARLCDLGAPGLHIPAEHGGAGASLQETRIVLAELGRFLTPGPLLGSVLASAALLSAGTGELLAGIADGSVIPSLVWGPYALNAQVADVFLVPREDGLYAVSPGEVSVTPCEAMDPTRRLATVSVTGSGEFLGVPDMDRVRDVACAALAAESAGAAARCLELTVAYAKQRTQFGRPIGSFQALKHRMADLHVLVETAESASMAADEDPATAFVWCAEAFTQVAGEMIQLHGGIAITWEHDAHLYFKRAHGNAHLFGAPREHVARLAAQLGK
ncbi:acyl-CoA dehydrogenase family protein [Actinophytocola sp.]|uniref:acyl-CoA dehydrogenase family protein n=1 Tax=Actinophytocola sp. TaxID=1872138 RepID=UPI002D250A61|nr:acyl-CoA dehydrogenase family protein [Actinophytocola sp.]HYQ68833.1 acyl-CoA dehydrogenase family protein [Actinophytocola sp.]